MRKIKKGDNVIVIAGKDKGKTGEVVSVVSKKDKLKVIVKGVNVVKKHQKPNQLTKQEGGILSIEKPVDISNVMIVDPKSGLPTRVGFKIVDGKKVRFAKKSGQVIK